MRTRSSLTMLLLLLIMTACYSQAEETTDTNVTIYTSIYPLQFITEQIAGPATTVESIYPPGVDAHSYEPSTEDITNIAIGDAFIYMGTNMEGFAKATAQALHAQEIGFLAMSDHKDLFKKDTENSEVSDADLDPHIWLDPVRMIDMAAIIKNKLVELTPDDEQLFKENLAALQKSLRKLDDQFSNTLKAKNDKNILVAHAAFGYWEDRYGVNQLPISGLSPGNEPSQKDLTKIVKLAEEKNIKHVIFEQNSSDRVATIIKDYLDATAMEIHNLEVLTEQDIENEEDYFSLMKTNLKVLDQIMD